MVKVHEPNRYFKRWQDVPDEFVKTYSERDPVNTVYRTQQWVNYKKRQIFYMQDPNIWTSFPYGTRSLRWVQFWIVLFTMISFYGSYLLLGEDYAVYRKKLKQMRETELDWKTPKQYVGVAVITPQMVGAE